MTSCSIFLIHDLCVENHRSKGRLIWFSFFFTGHNGSMTTSADFDMLASDLSLAVEENILFLFNFYFGKAFRSAHLATSLTSSSIASRNLIKHNVQYILFI